MLASGYNNSTTTYGYDKAGARVLQTSTTSTTYYPSKFFSLASSTSGGASWATSTNYLWLGDTLLATIDQKLYNGTATGSAITRYVHPDHLGSTNVVTDASGTIAQLLDYYPYGATRVSSTTFPTNENRQYIGQFSDVQTNLSYLQARYYDSARGQFVSEDPVFWGDPKSQNLRNPQGLNSYNYANGNPITNSDKSGQGAELAVAPYFEMGAEFVAGVTLPVWAEPAAVIAGTIGTGYMLYRWVMPDKALDPSTLQTSIGQGYNNDSNIPPRPPKRPWGQFMWWSVVTATGMGALYEYAQPVMAPDNGMPLSFGGNASNYVLLTPPQSTSNWSYSQIKLYTTPSGAVVSSDGRLVSGPPGSGSGGGGGGGSSGGSSGAYYTGDGKTPVKNSNGTTSYCLGVCQRH
jgi:RHS repeat-associated protein